jgi:formamidopyrimidine-DNA glycosylase
MAELPEIERYRIVLSDQLNGREMTEVDVNREKSINIPVSQFASMLQGSRITG